jgi:hypothetical protein
MITVPQRKAECVDDQLALIFCTAAVMARPTGGLQGGQGSLQGQAAGAVRHAAGPELGAHRLLRQALDSFATADAEICMQAHRRGLAWARDISSCH